MLHSWGRAVHVVTRVDSIAGVQEACRSTTTSDREEPKKLVPYTNYISWRPDRDIMELWPPPPHLRA